MRIAAIAALAVLLGACAGPQVRRPVPPEVSAEGAAREMARQARVQRMADWSLSGRIAVSNAGKGGSGRIDWRQQGDRFEVALSAPVTRQSWRLSGGPGGARLEGVEGGTREGADAAELLRDATGWDIPVRALADWLRALPAAMAARPHVEPGPDGRPAKMEQGGWSIGYEWPPQGDLPSRLDARRETARVRLIVDEWQTGLPDDAAGVAAPAGAARASGRTR